MKTKRKKGSLKLLGVCILATFIIVVVAGFVFNSGKIFDRGKTNYNLVSLVTTSHNSGEVPYVQNIGDISLERTQLVFVGETSKLTSKVTNYGSSKYGLRFSAKLIGYDGEILAEVIGYVGKLRMNETKYIKSYITRNVSDTREIIYKLI